MGVKMQGLPSHRKKIVTLGCVNTQTFPHFTILLYLERFNVALRKCCIYIPNKDFNFKALKV